MDVLALERAPSTPTATPVRTKVVIAQRSAVGLRGLEAIVAADAGLQVAGCAADLEAALACCGGAGACVVLIDPQLCEAGHARLLELLQQASGAARVVFIAASPAPGPVRDALCAGAIGYLSTGDDPEQIRQALHSAAAGRRVLAPRVVDRLADWLGRADITEREMDVLRLLSSGRCNKSIARELRISECTVKSHVSQLLSKLQVGSRMQAVLQANRLGLISI